MKPQEPAGAPSRPAGVRVTDVDQPADASRRRMLRTATYLAAAPATYLLFEHAPFDAGTGAQAAVKAGAARPMRRIVRDFQDPQLELIRLLYEAAEIEHSLMIQYLYCAFSVKPIYREIVGNGAPETSSLIGVAVQEMQHLAKVNQLLVALGAAPRLIRADFPFEPDIYPFQFNLEPMSRASLAKYVWTEAPIGAVDAAVACTEADRGFCADLADALGPGVRPNYVGSLYDAVIDLVKEVDARPREGGVRAPDLGLWLSALKHIKEEGEVGHYRFFRSLFQGTHPGFGGRGEVWKRAATDPLYPAYQLPTNPTAYLGHPQQIPGPEAQNLAWLGNLHYWILLSLLSAGYYGHTSDYVSLARNHMMGPFWSLARKLASVGAGMPFDPLSMGYAPGATPEANQMFLSALLAEAERFEKTMVAALPADYPAGACTATRGMLAQMRERKAVARLDPGAFDWA